MSITIELPSTISAAVQAEVPTTVQASPGTIRAILGELTGRWPSVGPRLLEDTGELHGFVNIYVDDVDARQMAGLDTLVREGQRLLILSAVSGG